ncbi:MAG: ZIP family metal transporter [Promethearchaeota archaeon]
MIKVLIWIILFSVLGSIGAIIAAGAFMFLNERYQKPLVPILISFATGVLLTAAFLGLIPEAIEGSGGESHFIMPFVLGGIIVFFFMEKIIIWRNCRNKECEVHSHASGPIILIGDSLHNLTDGIVIAAAFLTDLTLGIGAGLTILVHELAHETGDFGILLHSGYSKKKAFSYNIISSSTTIPAAIIGYFIIGTLSSVVPFILAISASSFIYIALSDLTPDLHQHTDLKYSLRQLFFILTGIVLMIFLLAIGGNNH